MHWKETVIKQRQIKWKPLKVANVEDGKLDIILTIPLTNLIEGATKSAFTHGMLTMLQFHIQKGREKKIIEVPDLVKLFIESGLPEVAKELEEKSK